MQWYLKGFRHYLDFGGRAPRAEYWTFVLVNAVISVALVGLDLMFGFASSSAADEGILFPLFSLAIIIPTIAVTVRRLHDIARNGWWLLISLIPIVGAVVLLVWLVTESKAEPNKWGRIQHPGRVPTIYAGPSAARGVGLTVTLVVLALFQGLSLYVGLDLWYQRVSHRQLGYELPLVVALFAAAALVGLIAIWYWRKWGVYLVAALLGAGMIVDMVMGLAWWQFLAKITLLGLLLWLAQAKWAAFR